MLKRGYWSRIGGGGGGGVIAVQSGVRIGIRLIASGKCWVVDELSGCSQFKVSEIAS